jgi:DNA-binding transcriptional regulator YdaS (Cro superfamily)
MSANDHSEHRLILTIGRSGHGYVDRADVRDIWHRKRDGDCDGGKDSEAQYGDSESRTRTALALQRATAER